MRYAVGDDYARDLAVEFYRRLLADPRPKTIAAALTAARKALQDPKRHDLARYLAADHATPVLYGEDAASLAPASGRSSALDDVRNRRLPRIAELSLDAHEHFVGRTWELADLGAGVIGTRDDAEGKPVAVVTGLGGMGKTALVAEALALWETRFQWVLLFQAKPNPLAFDPALRQIDERLRGELSRYLEHVQRWPAAAIHRDAAEGFRGQDRLDRLTENLLRAMRDEAILLVLDNFETNLKPEPEPAPGGAQVWACQDPAWDRCLARLATELVGTRSRVLITCRRPLAALVGTPSHPVPLGPLPAGEAALFLRDHPRLGAMVFGGDPDERALAKRLLRVSRFHPLLMDRLARLTMDPGLRPQLLEALGALERTGEHARLPELFATQADDDDERRYLEDALAASIDALLAGAPVEARRLLWMIATANEPVALGLLRAVWSGESYEQQQLRELKATLDRLPGLPAKLQAQAPPVPAELRGMLDALPEAAVPELMPALEHLIAVGLVTEERQGPDDDNPDLGCHEVVRERVRGWVEAHPEDLGEWTESALRLAYADRLAGVFEGLQHQNMALALEAGSRALVYAVQAGDYDRLGRFASGVVTGSTDPRLMTRLLPHLQAAADTAPEGQLRWSCLCYLADALDNGGRPDESLPFFAEAAAQARAVAEAGGDDARQAWSDLAVITGNWANALGDVGQLGAARQSQMDAAEAERKAGRPEGHVLGKELEALRIDIMQGKVEEALPEVESRLSQIETWWTQHREGKPVPEAPDAEYLARALIGALDIAVNAHVAQRAWQSALERIDAILEVERTLHRPDEDIAGTRVNRANILGRLERFGEAQVELEACLELFQNHPANRAMVLSSLADLFDKQGDRMLAIDQERLALALRNTLPNPHARAISHNNLSNYLEREGKPEGLAKAPRHQLAALLYRLVADLRESLKTSLRNYAVDFRRAHTTGTSPTLPTVADLLAERTFDALAEWLRQRDVDVSELQTAVDQLLERVRQATLSLDPHDLETEATPPASSPSVFPDLLAELEKAVEAGDHYQAHSLAQGLRRQIATDSTSPADADDQLRNLLAQLTAPAAGDDPIHEALIERGLSSRDQGVVYPVWFGTNRKPTDSGDAFTHERNNCTTLGRVDVHIPMAHRFGETGNSFWRRLRRLDLRDDRLRVEQVNVLEAAVFFAQLHEVVQASREVSEISHALIFLHGYNTTFVDAAIRAAQIGYDLKVLGPTAFFSWPSRGNVAAYPADEASIEGSEQSITDFIIEFATRCGAEKVHVIAHSMGNRGLLRAIQRIAAKVEYEGKIKFGQIFLAAPDVDRDLFLNLASLYPAYSDRTTLYASNADRAVCLSAWLHKGPRAGYFTPYTIVKGVDTIAVPDFDIELLGHSYFAQAEALLHDIFVLMRHGEDPPLRQRLVAATEAEGTYWRLLR